MVDRRGSAGEQADEPVGRTGPLRGIRRNPAFRRLADRSYDPSQDLRRCPMAVLSADLTRMEIDGAIPDGARRARVLVREGRNVLGTVEVPLRSGAVHRGDLIEAVDRDL